MKQQNSLKSCKILLKTICVVCFYFKCRLHILYSFKLLFYFWLTLWLTLYIPVYIHHILIKFYAMDICCKLLKYVYSYHAQLSSALTEAVRLQVFIKMWPSLPHHFSCPSVQYSWRFLDICFTFFKYHLAKMYFSLKKAPIFLGLTISILN